MPNEVEALVQRLLRGRRCEHKKLSGNVKTSTKDKANKPFAQQHVIST